MFEVIDLGGLKTVSAKSACNHVYVVDVSGSMHYDLPKIRQNLKNIVSVVAQPDDTFTVIYFSGRGQCGVVFENVLVSGSGTVDLMSKAIDRHLNTIGLTGFVDPLEKAMTLNLDTSKVSNFVMMTDGYDNQSSRSDILKKVEQLNLKYDSVSFIEYGYYADRDLISQMANAVGGLHIFAEGYEKYEGVIESVVKGVARVNNVEVKVNKRSKQAVYTYGDQIRIVDVVDGIAKVPEDTDKVYAVIPGELANKNLPQEQLYLILFFASKTGNSDLVWNALQALGDVALIEKYENAFTKQELSAFEEAVQLAVFSETLRLIKGQDFNRVPDKNAPTILHLLNSLVATESFLVMNSPYWEYNRIGRASTKEESLPRFVQGPAGRVSLKGLVFNSERPNVSLQTTLSGTVELPENDFDLKRVPSFVTRNYTIIKDGIRNMDSLPVVFPESEIESLKGFAHEEIAVENGEAYWVFDLSKIPVINRSMVESIRLDKFAETVGFLESFKASLKVLTHLIKEEGGSTAKTQGLIEKYGEDAAKWLSENGVRDYGFSPVGTKSVEATDEYESVQVVYKIKGLSSLPTIDAVNKKLEANKKLNVADELIAKNLAVYEGSDKAELESAKVDFTEEKRELEVQLAGMVYSLVLGRKWFGDEEVATTEVTLGRDLTAPMTVEKVKKMIKI